MMCEVRRHLQSRAIGAVEDTSEAQWLVEGLEPTLGTVGALVPRGFEAYARILHPAWRVRREGGRLVRSPVRWFEVAELRGTTAHRLMHWPQVWALPLFDDSAIEYCVDAGLAPIEGPDDPLCVENVNPQVDLSNFRLGLIGDDNEDSHIPLRGRMLGAIFGFAMRLGGRNAGTLVGVSKRTK